MKVWVVESGEYSAYSVDAIFLNEDDAHRYARADGCEEDPEKNYGARTVREWVAHESLGEPTRDVHLSVHLHADGTATDEHESVEMGWPGIDRRMDYPCRVSRRVLSRRDVEPDAPEIYLTVQGADETRCRKTYSELRARTIAEFDLLIARVVAAEPEQWEKHRFGDIEWQQDQA